MALKNNGGLGKGLNGLFGSKKPIIQPQIKGEVAGEINIKELVPNPYQPRKVFDATKLKDLVSSIKERGVIQPLIVRKSGKKYEIVAGERRWRAAKEVGLKTVPAVVREYDDSAMMEVALIENMQRSDLNPIEEAEGLKNMMEKLEITQADVAKKIGMSRTAVTNALRLLNLPETIKEHISKRELTVGQARPLLGLEKTGHMEELATKAIEENWSSRIIEEVVNEYAKGNMVTVLGAKISSLEDGAGKSKKKKGLKKARTKKEQDIYVKEFQNELTEYFGTKVRITQGKGDSGKIVVEYYTGDDLERIRELIEKGKNSKKVSFNQGSFSV